MDLPIRPETDRPASRAPVPHDVKKAVAFMRESAGHSISVADIARHCGVAERTLNEHFRAFLRISPMRYLRRLRLAAARKTLLAGNPETSVTEVAKQNGFNHFGRFAEHFRRSFGESPSETLRRAQNLARAGPAAGISYEGPPRRASREKPSVAVLPCQTPDSDRAISWLGESIAEGLAAALSSVGSLTVTAPSSARAPTYDPQRRARELNSRYVLTGKVLRTESRLRVILRLADASTGGQVWGDSFDGEPGRPLDLQDQIIASVLGVVSASIRGAEIERARCAPPQSLDAHGLAMRALPFVFASRPEAARRAIELLDRAIENDPDYGLVAALAAWSRGQLVMYNGTSVPADVRSQALELAERAAILEADDPLALAARCAVYMMAGELDTAEALVTRALAKDACFGWAWARSGWLHAYRGDSETAVGHFSRALSLGLNPTSRANAFAGIGSAHFDAGRYDTAAYWLRSALREQPGMAWANRSLSVSYARMGERVKALEALDALRRYSPDLTVTRVVTAVPFRPDFLSRLGNGLSGLGLPA